MSSIVQKVLNIVSTPTTTFNVTFPNPVTAGNAVLIGMFVNDPNGASEGVRFHSAVDNLAVACDFGFGGSQLHVDVTGLAIWGNVAGGATQYTINWYENTNTNPVSPSKYAVCAIEVTGASDPEYDQNNTNVAPATGTSQVTGLVSTATKSLLLGISCAMDSAASTFAIPSDMTLLDQFTSIDVFRQLALVGQIGTSGTRAYTLTTTPSSIPYGTILFSLAYTTNNPSLPVVVSAVFGNYFVNCS